MLGLFYFGYKFHKRLTYIQFVKNLYSFIRHIFIMKHVCLFNLLKTSPENTRAGVYEKCVL